MISSMTGFGRAECLSDGVAFALEIRSLNNRYYKASIKLPDQLQYFEPGVDKKIRSSLGRGTISYTLRARNQSAAAGYEVNRAALQQYVSELSSIDMPSGVTAAIDLATVSALPGVCQPPEVDEATRAKQWAVIEKLTDDAIAGLLEMRKTEGLALREDLLGHCRQLRSLVEHVAERSPQVVEEYHERLRTRVQNLLAAGKLELEKDALAREVAIYADRCDINEETSRLKSHIDQFERLCDSTEHAGRKLDFLSQELLRETNTIGSKSNDTTIAQHIIEMKALIDRLKEQVQNVE